MARERGGPDNITVAIARLAAETPAGIAPSGSTWSEADRVGWFLPLAIFLSFAAGVALTLWVERPPPLTEEAVRILRAEVEAALGEAQAPGGGIQVERLRERLERMRKALREPGE
jgi:hypothetical protein